MTSNTSLATPGPASSVPHPSVPPTSVPPTFVPLLAHGPMEAFGRLVHEGQEAVATVRHAAATVAADAGRAVVGVGIAVVNAGLPTRHQIDAAIDTLKHPFDPAGPIGRLSADGDTATFTVNIGGKLQAPFFGSPVPWGPQAQYGFDAKVKQVAGHERGSPPGFDVTFGKNLQAGLGAEEEAKAGTWGKGGPTVGSTPDGVKLGAELNIGSADQVTMHFTNKGDAVRAVRLMEQTAVAQAVRDSKDLVAPGIDPMHPTALLKNPLDGTKPLGAEGGFKVPLNPAGAVTGLVLGALADAVADRLQPSPAETAFLRGHIQSYTGQLTGSARIGVEAKLGNFFAIQGRGQAATRVSRTVTVPHDGRPGTVAYTLGGDLTLDGREKAMLKGKLASLGGGEAKATIANVADLGKLTGEVTATYNMTPAQTALARSTGGEDVPGLPSPQRIANPDAVNVKLQGNVPVQNPFLPHRTDQGQVTLSASLAHPRQDIGALLHGLERGDVGPALARLDTDGRVKLETARIERTGTNDTAELGLKLPGKLNAAVSAQVLIGTDHVAERHTWVDQGHGPPHLPHRPPEKAPVAPHDPSRA